MKNILFITAFPPNNKSGGQIFSLNLLKDLSTNYIVDVIYFSYKGHFIDPDIPANSIKSFAVDKFDWLYKVTIHPIFTKRFNKNTLDYISKIITNYDILYFDYLQIGLYSIYLNHPYKIIRCHDVLYQKFSRKNRIFKYWVKSTEKKILESVQKIFVPSEKDAYIVKKVYDFKAYFTHEYIKDFHFYEITEKTNIFVFYGVWSRKENLAGLLWFLEKVLPIINSNLGIKFVIIGDRLSKRIKQKYLSMHDSINCLGFIDNPLDIIYKARAVIAPLFSGAGVKVKVIDAFTTGTPVIGTDIAFEGLPDVKDLVYRAHTPKEYADIMINFPEFSYNEKQKNADIFKSLYDNNHLSDLLE
jgi:hypothetical protein